MVKMSKADAFFNAEESARRLGITTGRVRQICRDKHIGVKIGRDWLLTPDDLDQIRPTLQPQKNPFKNQKVY